MTKNINELNIFTLVKQIEAITTFKPTDVFKDYDFEALKKANNGRRIEVLSLDPGNSGVKGRSTAGIQISLPNHYVTIDDVRDAEDEKPFQHSKEEQTFRLPTFGDPTTYVWGEGVRGHENAITTHSNSGRLGLPAFKKLVGMSLAVLVGDMQDGEEVDVVLFVGLPSYQASKLKDKAKEAYAGTYTVIHNGIEKIINVIGVGVLSQPIGSYRYLTLGDNGGKLAAFDDGDDKVDLTKSKLLILDAGGITVDGDIIEKGKVKENGRSSIVGFGTTDIFEKIADRLTKVKEEGVPVRMVQAEAQLTDGDNFRWGRFKTNASDDKKEVIEDMSKKLRTRVESQWQDLTTIDYTFLVGGGAKFYSDEMQLFDKKIIILDQAHMTNAIGFHKFAMRNALTIVQKYRESNK